jgi:hypothetical protein
MWHQRREQLEKESTSKYHDERKDLKGGWEIPKIKLFISGVDSPSTINDPLILVKKEGENLDRGRRKIQHHHHHQITERREYQCMGWSLRSRRLPKNKWRWTK